MGSFKVQCDLTGSSMQGGYSFTSRSDLSPELDPFLVREKLSYHAACCANTAGGT